MWQSFYSNGKLLITGEYAVLDGALALAIPTKFGQHLHYRENDTGLLKWTGFDEENNIWFEQLFELGNLSPVENSIVDTSSLKTSERLSSILNQARALNPEFLSKLKGIEVETKTDFNRNWGLGTSSTLVNNIAQWASVDAFELNSLTFGGSGYDIGCAQNDNPIFYRLVDGKPEISTTAFQPPFAAKLYFVYLNKKMDSRMAIDRYRKAGFKKRDLVRSITKLSRDMAACEELLSFTELMSQHEKLISEALGLPTVKESLFPTYEGAIKSLGAWGGDFVLAASEHEDPEYFRALGFDTVIPFDEMRL